MQPAGPTDAAAPEPEPADVAALLPMVRRIVHARVGGHPAADDLVQETLVRVLAAAPTVEPTMLEAYTAVTAKNVIASMWREDDRHKRNRHRVLDLSADPVPEERVLATEEKSAIQTALSQLSDDEQRSLLAHEVSGLDTRTMASERGSTPGAVAAQLNRSRARLRVEYLLALQQEDPPEPQCRRVLLSLSSGDRRRQREADAARHLLDCEFCARVSGPLMERGEKRDDEVRVAVTNDTDIVTARQAARDLAARLRFSSTDLTLLATAVSEIARNIVRFAGTGEVVVEMVSQPAPGIRVVALDSGPGIPDLDAALRDGYSTNNSLGLGLPGARRLMDDFTITSTPGQGTTVTMTKWQKER